MPGREAASSTPEGQDRDIPAGNDETVLVVEDDESVRRLTVRMLELYGYATIPAVSPAEALELADNRETAIDLVLTDLAMSGGSGQELARTMRAVRPGVRILYMSGYASPAVGNGELVEGALCIQKPFVPQELARKVREALDAPWPKDAGGEHRS